MRAFPALGRPRERRAGWRRKRRRRREATAVGTVERSWGSSEVLFSAEGRPAAAGGNDWSGGRGRTRRRGGCPWVVSRPASGPLRGPDPGRRAGVPDGPFERVVGHRFPTGYGREVGAPLVLLVLDDRSRLAEPLRRLPADRGRDR